MPGSSCTMIRNWTMLSNMKPPAFETAVDIVNYACRLTRGTIDPADLNLRKNKYQLIKGKSTGGDAV